MTPRPAPGAATPEGLTRAIGAGGAALIVLNSMMGAGIYALPSALASFGAWGPWLFVLMALAMSTVVFAFARLAAYFDRTGGPVLYTKEAFGPFVSFETGWLLYLGRVTAMAANTNLLVDYAATLVPGLELGTIRAASMTAVIGLLTWANVAGLRRGMAAMTVLTVLKLAPLALLVLAGLRVAGPDAWLPATPLPAGDLGEAALLLVYALVGFEGALVTAGETRDPRRALPRAIVPTVLGVGLFYALVQAAYVGLGTAVNAASAAPLIDAARALFGPAGAVGMTLAAVFSIGGNLAAITVAAPRMTFALAFEGMLPAWFAGVRAPAATPDRSIIFLGAVSLMLAVSGSFLVLAAMSSLARMLAYAVSMASLPSIRRARGAPALERSDLLTGFAFVVCLWVAAQSTFRGWMTLLALAALGAVLYAAGRQRPPEAGT